MVNAMLIIGIIVAVIVIYIVVLFNSLVMLRNRVKNSWSQIDVQLKRRYDLIPNLIESVKGYMKHEKKVLTDITKLRSSLITGSLDERSKASDKVTDALKSIFAVAENYPDLKASENFKMLQEELAGTENKISYSRQYYNDTVMSYNNKVQTFPTNLFARMLNFKEEQFFKTEGKEREPVKVKFE